ncbi:hypothetical protein C1H46_040364 [Malus baccata]|uniref:Auxin-responsive protein n=1 Tax=Malus baccata TaxID=106549 RepID=A0A540KIQ1_MALBA|nr:hypothetical protein C1H46_040364 [Malus baccata]
MSPENKQQPPDGLNYDETKLTLGLPGSGSKRGFSETVDISLGSSCSSSSRAGVECCDQYSVVDGGDKTHKAPAKAQVVGWPPVRVSRKNLMKSCKYVKVAVDGAPYLRKVDLEMYNSYQQLLGALEDMFSFLKIRNYLNESKLMDPANGVEYVPTYEDRDGDWMLVGDVPWNICLQPPIREEKAWMHHQDKGCRAAITCSDARRRKAASMLACSRCAAVVAATRLVSPA